jgi:hypothetical protein
MGWGFDQLMLSLHAPASLHNYPAANVRPWSLEVKALQFHCALIPALLHFKASHLPCSSFQTETRHIHSMQFLGKFQLQQDQHFD